ncbi:PAP/fibrillin family protein [Thermaurantiacus tibetensis]|uniref:PAP/fibrillin family protein n=1 Tax=Thermaurantiacus tibetensis TaxID=2759035 RepID=UPI00188EC6A2|nr:PAP/fibrillin family protein [Thermaurantiacus tibetensis]
MADREALKAELSALGAATEAGFAEGGRDVERIAELAAALEALNPTPEPARAAALLRGRWELLWSSFGLQREATLARLSFNLLPKEPIRVERLFQDVDPDSGLYDNGVTYRDAAGREGLCVTLGRFAPADGTRLDVAFTHVQASGHGRAVIDNAKIPPLWSDVVYLDDDFRLNRGSFGSLYVLRLAERAPAGWARDA